MAQISLTFPDGNVRSYPAGTTPAEVAASIAPGLAKKAISATVDGRHFDLQWPLNADAAIQINTSKDEGPALELVRHDLAHIMARAVMRLFPGAQLAFGPALENGFYYDIDAPTPIREEDFPRIEEEMRKIVADAEPFERFERSVDEARELVRDLGQGYKVEHIDDDLKRYPSLSFYRQGEFIVLCRGPHIPHAGKVGAIKLLSIAGP